MNTILEFIIGIPDFLNKNMGIITLVVGFFAIGLYLKQKSDHKRDAAKLILQEIRYVEQKIRDYKKWKQYKLFERLLPTNNWNKNIHLFIKELKETENLDLISDFYAKASYIDNLIATISKQKNSLSNKKNSNLSKLITPITLSNQQIFGPQNSFTMSPVQPNPSPPTPLHQSISQPITITIPAISQEILNDVSMSVEFIYNTPIVEKLRNIAEKKWWKIL